MDAFQCLWKRSCGKLAEVDASIRTGKKATLSDFEIDSVVGLV